ncbi:histidine utilization repressor [Sphingomonas populi]|uniref:Histidine utilization repressor n=1 Tax=Sphingomonas populi TaxID=2484750 RepID=A0A4Q6XXD1_9SPHN|nr:histidine utilization repressor [Sphingomonas populi]RZF65050.1 histidine utilization repressor [Sphingomonas populi]
MRQPLHERIRSDFEARILSGELAPGDRIPIEQDLMQHYGCARMTVNKALSALLSAGLIDRRKRAGTFVARPRMHSMVLDVPDLPSQIRERGQVYAYFPIGHRLRPPAPSRDDEMRLAGGGDLFELEGLHLADDIPLALEYRLISVLAVPDIGDATDIEAISPGSWLLKHVPWTEAETRISALEATAEEARLLRIPQRSACLCVERRTWRGSDRITYVRQVFVGNSYDLVARFGATR